MTIPSRLWAAAILSVALCCGAAPGSASAQARASDAPGFPGGVYSDKPGCASTDVHHPSQPTLLRASGLEAIEYFCEFAEVRPVFGGDGWLALAACQEPGYFFPEMFLISVREVGPSGPLGPATLSVVSGGGQGDQETVFHRCAP